jgi:hypothetical protein
MRYVASVACVPAERINESCRYEDGLRIFSANTRGGHITRHVVVQAWHEA